MRPPEDLLGFLRASKQRTRLVEALSSGPKTPSDLAALTQLHRSNVSRALSELQGHGLVYCQTPELRKGKLYALTPESAIRFRVRDTVDALQVPDPMPDLESSFAPRVQGEALTSGVAGAAEILGPDGLLRLCLACGFNFLGFEREDWYPMRLHHTFLKGLSEMADGDGLELCREMGRRSIDHLPFMQRFLADRNVGVMALFERAPLAHGHYFNFGRFEVVPHSDGVEIRQSDMLPIKEFCAAREGNYVGVLAAKGLRVEVKEGRCEVDGDAYCGFRIRVKGPLESGAAG